MVMTRRELLKAGSAAALATPLAAIAQEESKRESRVPLRFGVIADPQFAPIPNKWGIATRYYGNSIWKLSESIERLNQEELNFVVILGDIVDRYWESFRSILPLFDELRHEKFFLLGNHDFNVPNEYLRSILPTVGMKSPYYDFVRGGFRFIALDGNDVSVFAPPAGDPKRDLAQKRLAELTARDAPNAQSFNGSLSDTQYAWLHRKISDAAAANEKIILFNHYPVFPDHRTNLWDSERLVKIVCDAPNVVAYLNGHNHAGNYGVLRGKHFLTFKGMVETPTETAYAIVEVFPDRLEVRGFGLEESRTLRFV